MLLGLKILCKVCLLVTFTLMSWLKGSFRFAFYGSDPWKTGLIRRYIQNRKDTGSIPLGDGPVLGTQPRYKALGNHVFEGGRGAVTMFAWRKIGVKGDFVWCLMIVFIFMGLGGVYRLGEGVKVIIWGTRHKGIGSFFNGGVNPSRHHVNILIWQLEEG